jgi:hypothetical protein
MVDPCRWLNRIHAHLFVRKKGRGEEEVDKEQKKRRG